MTKTCTQCGETKPLTEFHKRAGSKYGVRADCKACVTARGAVHYQANKSEIDARNNAWRQANRERDLATKAAWYQANKAEVLAQQAAQRRADRAARKPVEKVVPDFKACSKCGQMKLLSEFGKHPEGKYGLNPRCKACVAARRAVRHRANPHLEWEAGHRKRSRQFGFVPVVELFTREDVVARYGDACFYCDTGEFEELDHSMPIAAHGPHTLDNVRPSCMVCNRRKKHAADRVLTDVYHTVADAVAAYWSGTEEEESA